MCFKCFRSEILKQYNTYICSVFPSGHHRRAHIVSAPFLLIVIKKAVSHSVVDELDFYFQGSIKDPPAHKVSVLQELLLFTKTSTTMNGFTVISTLSVQVTLQKPVAFLQLVFVQVIGCDV